MKYRKFGNTDLVVSQIGLGCSRLGGTIQQRDDQSALRLLSDAFDNGISFYDTADIYAQGNSERLLGRAFRHKRDRVVLASKVGMVLSNIGMLAAHLKPLVRPFLNILSGARQAAQHFGSTQKTQNFSSEYVKRAVEASLDRLKTDYLDLLQLHCPTAAILENGECMNALQELKQQGKVRFYGISCGSLDDAHLWVQHPKVTSVQVEINLLNEKSACKFLTRAQRTEVAVIARQPFGSGSLLNPRVQVGIRATEAIPNMMHAALQFALGLDGVAVVLPGIGTRSHLAEIIAAVDSTPLTEQEMATARTVASIAAKVPGAVNSQN